MDRRRFITLTAATGVGSLIGGCAGAEHTLVRFIPEDDITPGIAEWTPGVCPLCPSGCGLTVRVMDADVEVTRAGQAGVVRRKVAKLLEGQPAHPINRGAVCPRGVAAIQVTYHPDRIAQPLKRIGARGEGRFEAISWDAAIAEVVASLDRLAAANRTAAVVGLARPGRSHRRMLFDRFLTCYGAEPALTVELFDDRALRRANALSFGRDQLPTYDLANSRMVVNFGADLLATWNSPVANSVAFGAMRRGRRGIRGRLVQLEARMSYTGASADQWLGVAPGREGLVALAMAHVIMDRGWATPAAAGRAGRQIAGFAEGLPAYAPDRVATAAGLAADRIVTLATAFAQEQPAVAVVGGPALAHTNGLSTALAVNALNALVGAVGVPGGLVFTPQSWWSPAATERNDDRDRSVATLGRTILGSTGTVVEAVLLDGVDPVYASPPAWRVADALARVPLIVSFSQFVDDTSMLADLILPDHSFLETWAEALPESGSAVAVASVAGPVMRPLLDTRATPDVLIELAGRLQRPLTPPLPWSSFQQMIRESLTPGDGPGATWDAVVARGGLWAPTPSSPPVPTPATAVDTPIAPALPDFAGAPDEYPFYFLPYASQASVDGTTAHLPWLQEMPDPLTSAMWSSWIELNPETAHRLGITNGDLVEVTSPAGVLRAPVVISPGIAPDVVAMPVGQGHDEYTRYARGRGVNPVRILADTTVAGTGGLAWAATRVRVSRTGPADGSLIQFAGTLHESGHGRQRR